MKVNEKTRGEILKTELQAWFVKFIIGLLLFLLILVFIAIKYNPKQESIIEENSKPVIKSGALVESSSALFVLIEIEMF